MKKIVKIKGLSSPNVRKILEDSNGYIWMATQDGLNLFDGVNCLIFNSNRQDVRLKTSGNDFHDIVFDKTNKCIWAVTSNGGLDKIDITSHQVKSSFHFKKQIKMVNLFSNCLFLKDTILYIGIQQGYIAQFNTKTEQVSKIINLSLVSSQITFLNKIYIDSSNIIWAFTENRGLKLLRFENDNPVAGNLPGECNINLNRPFLVNSYCIYNSRLLVSSNQGFKCYDVTKKSAVLADACQKELAYLFQTEVYALYSHNNQVFFSTNKGLYVTNVFNKSCTHIIGTTAQGNASKLLNNIFAIYATNSQVFLGTTIGAGIIRNTNSPFTTYFSSLDDLNTKIDHAFQLRALNDSMLYVCSSSGLYTCNLNTGIIKEIDSRFTYYNLFIVSKRVFACTENEIFEVINDKIYPASNRYHELEVAKGDFIIASAVYMDSLVFLGSQNKKGIYQWDVKRKAVMKINDSTSSIKLKSMEINTFFIDSEQRLMIVCDNIISAYDFKNKKIQHFYIKDPDSDDPIEILMDICHSNNGYYICAYGKGVIQVDRNFRVNKIFSPKNGVSNVGLYKIFSINDSMVLATSNAGIFLINLKSSIAKTLTMEDGLQSNSFEETSGCLIKNFIVVGGIEGLTKIDPDKLVPNKRPPTFYFTNIKTEIKGDQRNIDSSNLEMQKIDIASSWLQTSVSFIGINYSNPEGVTYEYRIKERDTAWININHQNSVNLIGLSPGTYHLQVRAANEDDVWSDPKTLTLIFEPKWYQTSWFYISLTLAVAALLYALYRYRVTQINKQHQIRKEIATDLHDDIGSTLNSVKIYTHLAETAPDKQQYFDLIKNALKQASVGLRDMIWVLDDKNDNVEELFSRLKQFANPLALAVGIKLDFLIEDSILKQNLDKTEKRNLLLIAKEAINNSIKYAACKNIQVSFLKTSGHKTLRIRDDGRGFSKDSITPGNGLKNMQERAKQIHYSININSAEQNGTVITVRSL